MQWGQRSNKTLNYKRWPDWSVVQWLSHVHLTCNMLPLEHDCWSVCKTLPLDFECCRGCKMLPLDLDCCKVWWDACMWFKSLLFSVPGTLTADLNKNTYREKHVYKENFIWNGASDLSKSLWKLSCRHIIIEYSSWGLKLVTSINII